MVTYVICVKTSVVMNKYRRFDTTTYLSTSSEGSTDNGTRLPLLIGYTNLYSVDLPDLAPTDPCSAAPIITITTGMDTSGIPLAGCNDYAGIIGIPVTITALS